MSPLLRTYGIPVLTLLIGWQLGVGYTQQSFIERLQGIEAGSAGSGVVLEHPEREADIGLVWRVWSLLNTHYIDPSRLTSNTLVEGAAEGLVRAVGDPYTVYMTPEENSGFRESLAGTLQGIGAELALRDGLVVIVAPLKGSPAERAGLLPSDVIAEVDGESVEGMDLNDVVTRVRGVQGTAVALTVVRPNTAKPLTIQIVREEIRVPSVEAKIITKDGEDVGYIALNQFGDRSIDELRAEVETMKKKPVKALILDLRFNGGGYLEGAVELVSLFQGEGTVVSVRHRTDAPQNHFVSGKPLWPDVPLVVLQNEASASASEIVSGALQDHKRATIMGMKSYGKGTVQEIIDLPGGGSLRVTVAKWLTPNGKDLGTEGVHPDIEVTRTADDYAKGLDPQLDAAVEWLLHGKRPAPASSSSQSGS